MPDLSRGLGLIEEHIPPVVGRTEQIAPLVALLEQTAARSGGVVVITGEPGIGKTTLARYVVDTAEERGFETAWAWCWASGDAPPLFPWNFLAAELGWESFRAVDVPSAFTDAVEELKAASIPTVIVLDDAHGADEATLSLVNLLGRSLRETRLLIVLTVCEEDVAPNSQTAHLLDEISRGGNRLDLFSLSKEESTALLASAGRDIPPLIADSIVSASDGNPFLIEQLVKEVVTGKDLHRPDRSLGFQVPRGADAVLERILRRLSPSTSRSLEVAAILGRTFDSRLLAAIAQLSESEVAVELAEGIEKGALRRIDSLGTYTFTHALLRELLYEGLDDESRRKLHLAAATALEGTNNPRTSEVAQHLFKAGPAQPNVERAVQMIEAAARLAEEAGAEEEAARQRYRATRLARAAGLSAPREQATAPPSPPPKQRAVTVRAGTFRKEGEYWAVGLGGSEMLVRDSKGMGYIASLLRAPQTEWHCLEMASPSGKNRRPVSTDTGPVLDARAKTEFKRRLHDLEEEIAEAMEFNDDGRLRKAEAEKQFLIDELSAATGLGGRDRVSGSDSERARVAVTRAIRSALRRIAVSHADLGDHLDRTIHTGTFLSYRPDPAATPSWEL